MTTELISLILTEAAFIGVFAVAVLAYVVATVRDCLRGAA